MSVLLYGNNKEIVYAIEAIANEKNIKREVFFDALESSLIQIAKDTFGSQYSFVVHIGRVSGLVEFMRKLAVVEKVQDEFTEISLENARKIKSDAQLGDSIDEDMPTIELGHDIMHRIYKDITNTVLEAEKSAEYRYFKNLHNKNVTGIIKRVSSNGALVALDRFECFLPRKNLLFAEYGHLKNGQKITGVIDSVQRNNFQSQAILSRTSPAFLANLFESEIPEIYDGIIKIKAIAREAGSRSKVAVFSEDSSVDPVATCIGVRGKKIQNITKELGEEKIDMIAWHPDAPTFLINALKNIPVVSVVADHKNKTLDVVLTEENISNAIGRRGQNVRLLSNLTGWAVHFMTETENSQKRVKEFERCVLELIEALDLDEIVAQLLVAAGFNSVQDIVTASVSALQKIEGFNHDIAEAIYIRATEIDNERVQELQNKIDEAIKNLSSICDVSSCDDVIRYMILNNYSIQDIADFSTDEIQDIMNVHNINIDSKKIGDAIIVCRKYCSMI